MADYPLTVGTLGKLADVGQHLQLYCADWRRGLRLIEEVGRDWHSAPNAPLRCPLWDGDRIETRISSGPPAGNPPEALYSD